MLLGAVGLGKNCSGEKMLDWIIFFHGLSFVVLSVFDLSEDLGNWGSLVFCNGFW